MINNLHIKRRRFARIETVMSGLISAAFMAGLLLGFNGHPTAPKHRSAVLDDAVEIEMPALAAEPPEVEKVEDLPAEDEAQPAAYAPPSLVDIPTIAPDATFVQEIAPPPPPGIDQPKDLVTIPPPGSGSFAGHRAQVFDLSQLDQKPVVRIQNPPVFPADMRRRGISGEVNIRFIVDPDGNVRDPEVVSATNFEFQVAALQAVSKWKFRPGRRNGRSVSTWMTEDLGFQLE